MSEPDCPRLHITFVCTGNICRSPMAEKMFAHQICQRGLHDAVRVTSAGTAGWHIGRAADERANRVLRAHGYPTDHSAAQIDIEHLEADLVVALARNHVGLLRQLGVDGRPNPDAAILRPSFRRLCSRRRRSLLRRPRRLRSGLRRHRGFPARVCTPGSTSNLPRTDSPDASAGLPAATGLGGAGGGGHRVHLLVFQRARAVAAREEHQDVAGEQPDRSNP